MRKSVILPGVAVAGGLVGLLVRRVYLAHGFEAGTGLPISGAPSLWAMVLVSAAVAAALLVLSRGKHRKFDQCYTGAFSPDTTPLLSGALAGAVLLAIGGFLALAAWAGSPRTLLGQRTMSIAWAGLGVLSLLAAAGIYFVAQKMRRGAPILTAWAVVPGFACCLWIMANYYQSWAEEPVLGQYLIPMLGALLSMIACFLVGGFAFGKARVTLTLTVCLAAGAFNIMALADGLPLADTALYLGMMFYLLSMAAALARNDAKPEARRPAPPTAPAARAAPPWGPRAASPPPARTAIPRISPSDTKENNTPSLGVWRFTQYGKRSEEKVLYYHPHLLSLGQAPHRPHLLHRGH